MTSINTASTASLATGAPISPDTWADFVRRLHHDCVGEGVMRHYTADSIFIVQARRLILDGRLRLVEAQPEEIA